MSLAKWIESNKDNMDFYIDDNGNINFQFSGKIKPINDKETLLSLIEKDAYIMKYASNAIKNDLEIAKLAVAKSPSSISFFSEAVRNDKGIIEIVLKTDSHYFCYIGDKLAKDREFIKKILEENLNAGEGFFHISRHYKEDREINLAAAKSGCSLHNVEYKYQNDKEVVLAYVSRNKKTNLSKVSDEMKNDFDVVLAAIKATKGFGFTYAGPLAKDNVQLAIEALSYDDSMLKFTSKRIKEIIQNSKSACPVAALEAYVLENELPIQSKADTKPKI